MKQQDACSSGDRKRFRWLSAASLAGLVLLGGCGTREDTIVGTDDADLIDELLDDQPSDSGTRKGVPADRTPQTSEFPEHPSSAAVPVTATARGERLELRLQKGDRFPLIKTIEQTLIQKSQQFPAVAHTRLELTMAIQVEENLRDAVQLSVRYSRVVYAHDLNGDRLEFDSAVQQNSVPHDAQPYAGMVNNGFSFVLGRDNRIRELVGYQDFLQRCVAEVAPERRQTLLAEISTRFGDDGVASFVDESIGLLPYDGGVDPDSATRVAPGDVWTREHRMMLPAPIYLTSTYRLISLDTRTAEIDITGRIASGETVTGTNTASLRITGGHSLGKCTVDRATGLPLEMNQTSFVMMVVTLPDGQQFPQDKQITTTIRAFPETRGPVVQQPERASAIRTVGARSAAPAAEASRLSADPGNSTAVQAVYPEP